MPPPSHFIRLRRVAEQPRGQLRYNSEIRNLDSPANKNKFYLGKLRTNNQKIIIIFNENLKIKLNLGYLKRKVSKIGSY